jgi:3',5'-cyclic AMP phosphodiesterase CpdA
MKRIAHISDLHFGRHDFAVAAALVADLREAAPDLVIVSGDLTQRARRREFRAARQFLDSLEPPVLAVPGNHDVPLYDLAGRFLGPYSRFRRYIGGPAEPFVSDGEIAILGLNTARAAAFTGGRVSHRQAASIQARFKALPPEVFKVLVTHHPLISPAAAARGYSIGRSELALQAVADCGVDLLLSGHFHRAFSTEALAPDQAYGHSLLVIEAGTALSTRRRGESNAYNLIRIDGAAVELSVRAWSEEGFRTRRTLSFNRSGGIWRPCASAA